MKRKIRPQHIASVFLIAGSLLVLFISCGSAPQIPPGYEEGLEWGKLLAHKQVKDYEVVYHMTEEGVVFRKAGFRSGFIVGYGADGERIIDILFEAAESEEFKEGKRAGEKLREETITDILIRDYIVSLRIKSVGKRAGWRCGFIIGYKSEGYSYEYGEAIYRSIESSTF